MIMTRSVMANLVNSKEKTVRKSLAASKVLLSLAEFSCIIFLLKPRVQ